MKENDNQHDQPTQTTTQMAKTVENDKASSATESPPTQTMERSDESSYRIPPHVFERSKSSNPADWSSVSNESLFSIHMDSNSFNSFVFDHSFETGDEVIKGGGDGLTKEKLATIEEDRTHHPRESGASTASFAFPALIGNSEKDASPKIIGPMITEPEKPTAETPNTNKQSPAEAPNTDKQSPPNTRSKKEASKKAGSKRPKENHNTTQSWFSCFLCCRSSS